MKNFSLKEKKKAILRNDIMHEMIRLLDKKELNEISVEELCQNVNTSKVTFFKYFSYKEQVLDYFVYKWQYERSYEVSLKMFQGIEGIYEVFRSVDSAIIGKKFMVSLANYYTKLKNMPPIIELSPYEYYLFNETAFNKNVHPINLEEIFIHYVSSIKTISSENYGEVVKLLIALFYGVPIQAHIMGQEELFPVYELGIKCIMKLYCE